MQTYREWLIARGNNPDRTIHPIDQLAYSVAQGEFRWVEFETPLQLQTELSSAILLSERMEQAINFSGQLYIEDLHNTGYKFP